MKEARVVEEVVVGKDVEERTETVRDALRRTDVRVERRHAARARGRDVRAGMEAPSRHVGRRSQLRTAAPAYLYGGELVGQERAGGEWSTLEPEARRRWEERHPGTWERFKDAIRHGWLTRRGGSRAA